MSDARLQLSGFPINRMRRLRQNAGLRDLVREHTLSRHDLIYPLFVYHGINLKREIASMPGQHQWSLDRLGEAIDQVVEAQVPAVILFGIPAEKDSTGASACHDGGIVQRAVALITGEENIGTAFQKFKDLQEKWKTIGNVPAQQYRELQSDYSHLLDEFFYHIRIYKELRDHDLRKNTALKQALISDMQSLAQKDNIRELREESPRETSVLTSTTPRSFFSPSIRFFSIVARAAVSSAASFSSCFATAVGAIARAPGMNASASCFRSSSRSGIVARVADNCACARDASSCVPRPASRRAAVMRTVSL